MVDEAVNSESVTPTDNTDGDNVTEVVETEEKPKGKPETVPIGTFLKLKEEAKETAVALEAARREAELLKTSQTASNHAQQDDDLLAPNPLEFDDDDKYQAAATEFYTKLANKQAQDTYQKNREQEEAARIKSENERRYQDKLAAHDERVRAFNADNYAEVEDIAKYTLSGPVLDDIKANFANSAELIYALGSDLDAEQKIKDLVDKQDSIGAVREIVLLSEKLKTEAKSTDSLPEPDEALKGGSGGSGVASMQAQLDKLRKAQDIRGAIEFKREAAAKGITLV